MLQNKGIVGIELAWFSDFSVTDYLSSFSTWSKSAIMDKCPWDTDAMQRIICVLQLKVKEAVRCYSPPPSRTQ